MSKHQDLFTIDWDKALTNVGDDKDFLDEVIQDFLVEAERAESLIEEGIKRNDFETIEKEAHKIKGSASYLYCEKLENISHKLQDLGRDGKSVSKDRESKLWRDIEDYFDEYKDALKDFKRELRSHK